MDLPAARDAFVLQLQADGRSPHYQAQARRQIGLLARWAQHGDGPTDVRRLRHEDVARFLGSPIAQRTHDGRLRKTSSANVLRTMVRLFGRYLVDAGYTDENVARLVRLARCGKAPPRALSDDDVRRLLAAVDGAHGRAAARDGAFIRLLVGTGLRVSSALALRRQDVDLHAGEIRVNLAKGGTPLVLPMSRVVARELRIYLRTVATEVLFPGPGGQRPLTRRQAGSRLAHWGEVAGLTGRATPHALRHTFGTQLYRRTGDLLVVQAALGHADVGSSTVYARLDQARLRAALRG